MPSGISVGKPSSPQVLQPCPFPCTAPGCHSLPWLRLAVPPRSGHRSGQEAGPQALRGQAGLPAGLREHPHGGVQPPAHRHRGAH